MMTKNNIVEFAANIVRDGFSLLGIPIPASTSQGLFQNFMKKRAQKARDILLDELRQCNVHPSDVANQDECISVIYRYAIAVRDNVAFRNLRLLAQAIRGMLNQRTLYADEFSKYAEALSRLSREEIIVLGTLYKCKLKKREALKREPYIVEYWQECVCTLVPSMFDSEMSVLATVCAAQRSGLVVNGTDMDSGDLYGTSPFMDEVFQLVDFQEALRKEDAEL